MRKGLPPALGCLLLLLLAPAASARTAATACDAFASRAGLMPFPTRGEGDGWARHLTTDPPPGTPAHLVVMHAARGRGRATGRRPSRPR